MISGRHLLFIAFPFPPSRGGGVYRTVATANYLASHGWKVTVVAPEEEYFARYQGSEDRSLLAWISPRIDVQRVRVTNWLREDDLRRKSLLTVAWPRRARKLRIAANRFLSPLDHYPFWVWPATVRALDVARRNQVDVVLATGNPFSSFLVAGLVGRLARLPYVLDYRDAWTFDQFTGELKPNASDVALALERRLLHDAAGVIAVNKAILDWLTVTHSLPGAVQKRVMQNGFDPEFVRAEPPEPLTRGETGPRFSYVGTIIPEKLDWLRVLTDFDATLAEVDPTSHLNIHGHLGFSSPQAGDLIHLFEHHDRITYNGSVKKAEVADVYANSDVLFLPMYESPFVTSGKVYEMMATGKPILAWGSPKAGALVPLAGYPKLVVADPMSPASLQGAVSAALELARKSPPQLDEAARAYAQQFERDRQLRIGAALLRSVVSSFDSR